MNLTLFHSTTKSSLFFPTRGGNTGWGLPQEVWLKSQRQSGKSLLKTTFRGGFFMAKNEVQIPD
ncbi:hypothetical protein [Belliella buryatensis]|uniref:hypothetical protein n=1 Tax=Belliella buryatensis TaxID=1500549 RepID=UPI000B7774B7|nr:hypothetical protein [Belliella buryatensis]